MKLSLPSLLSCLIVSGLSAQTQVVRGKIENVRNTTNQFFLDCTNIPLTSTKLNLNLLMNQQFVMQVINKGTAAKPSLEIQSVTAAAKIFDMGNLRLGRSDTWQVRGKANSSVAIGITATSLTGYAPMSHLGAFLLGPHFVLMNRGTVNTLGVFQFKVQPPNLKGLIGISFTGQALVQEPNGTQFFSNPDCKEVRSK